jgi:hypothetical protein
MSFGGTTPPVVRHLLLCQEVEYDFNNPGAPYSLRNILNVLGPEPGESYPIIYDLIWMFIQGSGDPGQYEIWIDLAPIDELGDTVGDETVFGPWLWILQEGEYVECGAWKLRNLPFLGPGLYEIKLRCGPDVLAREEVLLVEG